jgi:hypothetical protein
MPVSLYRPLKRGWHLLRLVFSGLFGFLGVLSESVDDCSQICVRTKLFINPLLHLSVWFPSRDPFRLNQVRTLFEVVNYPTETFPVYPFSLKGRWKCGMGSRLSSLLFFLSFRLVLYRFVV